MDDPFLHLARPVRPAPSTPLTGEKTAPGHTTRKHSKFSASGAERWLACPGSVELSEGLPDKSSPWAEEGTQAHEALEKLLNFAIKTGTTVGYMFDRGTPLEMQRHVAHAARFILDLHHRNPGADLMVETRIILDFIHPEMFGTFDGAIVDHFGTLHVIDFKYGAGHAVSPKENLQMIFYALGLAHRYQWNFKRARLWIIQPRIRGYDGPAFWELDIPLLQEYVDTFKAGVQRVTGPAVYTEGAHCHWCRAKSICPLKQEAKLENAKSIFTINPYHG